uniref:Tail fiber protein H n=1 Tax=Aliivibrio phage vB_Alvi_H905 TaxID=3234039 RepID=A0AB39C9V2_9VIRU
MNYSTIPTVVGAAKLRNASLLGKKVDITRVAFGDGDGAEYEPTGQETALKNQVYECPPNRIEEEAGAPTWIELEAVIPHNVGGWYLREVCCFDDEDDLIFIGNIPSSFKPSGEAGVIKDLVFEMVYDAVAADVVQIKIDPNVVIATREYVDKKVLELERKDNAATDKDIDSESQDKKHVKLPQLWRAIRKYVLDKLWLPLAELIYPVGSPIPYPGTEAPSDKYIAFIGQAFDMVAFPMLAERYPSGIMPDLRKGYIRGLGEGEEALSFKAQSVQPLGFEGEDMDPHQHSVTMRGGNVASGGSSGFYMSYQQQWSQTQKTQAVSAGKAKGIITGTGDETNPNSYRFLFITRAA